MKGYKNPTFEDRVASAAAAKEAALAQLRARKAPDPAELETRRAAAEARETARAEARAEAKAAKKLAAEAAAEAEAAANPPPPTDEERKSARDARYAARKART
jgi:hypothetical protein